MHFSSFVCICLSVATFVVDAAPFPFPAAVAYPEAAVVYPHLVKRQTGSADLSSQLLSNIASVSADLTSLNKTLNIFRADSLLGLLEALTIQLQTSKVSSDLIAAAQTAETSTNFTSEESNTIAQAVINLEPVIFSTLNNIVEHKPAFATAVLFVGDLSLTVEHDLEQQRQLSSAFGSATAAKLAEPYGGLAPLRTGQIDSAFVTAIAAYQSCSGIICLPPITLKRRLATL